MAGGQRGHAGVRGLLKLVALVGVAGGTGVGIGLGLAQLSDNELAVPAPGTATSAAARPAAAATVASRTTTRQTTSPSGPVTSTTPAASPSAQVDVRILGAILRPAGQRSGRQRQRARLIMRVRARNGGAKAVTLDDPILRVGSVRIRLDANANPPETRLGTLAADETKSVTLRYELAGDATPKVTRDRRARIDVGAQSVPLRVKVGAPLRPPA